VVKPGVWAQQGVSPTRDRFLAKIFT
jgi:hypothetical protein